MLKLFILIFFLMKILYAETEQKLNVICTINEKIVPVCICLPINEKRINRVTSIKKSFSNAITRDDLLFICPRLIELSACFKKGSLQNVLMIMFVNTIESLEEKPIKECDDIHQIFKDLIIIYSSMILTSYDVYFDMIKYKCEKGSLKKLFDEAWIRFYSKSESIQ